MHLNIEISQAVFEQLKKQARTSGETVEAVAGQKLAEMVTASSASEDASRYWNYQGRSWTSFSKAEIAERYKAAASAFAGDVDEFAWHLDDSASFEEAP